MAPIALPPAPENSTIPDSTVIPWNNKIKSRTILPVNKEAKKEDERERIQDQIISSAPLKKPAGSTAAGRAIMRSALQNNEKQRNNKTNSNNKPKGSALNQSKDINKPLKISSKPELEEKQVEEAAEEDEEVEEGLVGRFQRQMTSPRGRVAGVRRRSELLATGPRERARPLVQNSSARRHPRFEPLAVLLDSATRGDLSELRRLLTRTRIPVNSCNSAGLTALHCAIAHGHVQVAEFLLAQGAKVNVCDDKGWSPLHMAVANDDLEAVRLLLDYNADVEAVTDDRQTPLELSQEPVSQVLEKMLEQKYKGSECLAMYDFEPQVELASSLVGDELAFVEGEVLHIVNRKNGDWWLAENVFGHRGFVPKTHLQ